MNDADIDNLIREISADAPGGKDLWNADIGNDLSQRLNPGAGAEPNWSGLRDYCVETLKTRSKDLRVAVHLTLALLVLDGPAGLRQGILVIRRLLTERWECLYPRDLKVRKIILEWLAPRDNDERGFLVQLPRMAITGASPDRLSLLDIQVAAGKRQAPAGVTALKPPEIAAAFARAGGEVLGSVVTAIDDTQTELKAIATLIGEKKPPPPDFGVLTEVLAQIRGHVAPQADRLKPSPDQKPNLNPDQQPIPGVIQSERDVISALESICAYYKQCQPSSPIPYLLLRAKRWIGADFVALVSEMAPGSKENVTQILGVPPPPETPPETPTNVTG